MRLRDRNPGTEMDSLAQKVLDHLDLERDGLLLSLGPNHRRSLKRQLQGLAQEALADLDLPQANKDAALSSTALLVEIAVEGQGLYLPAAALYALAHDDKEGNDDPTERFEAALLRYKLAHVLLMADEENPTNIQRCAAFTSRTVPQVEKLWRAPGIPTDAFFDLIFHLQSWLGHRYDRLELYDMAAQAFSQASVAARSVDDRVAYTAHLASVMDKQGKTQQAYELLLLVREDLPEVEDSEVSEMWRIFHAGLHHKLGGPTRLPEIPGDPFPLVDEFSSIQTDSFEHFARLDSLEFKHQRTFLEEAINRTVDARHRHQLLVGLALLIADKETDHACALLQEARDLESSFEDQSSAINRKVLEARIQRRRRNFRAAWEVFEALLPTVAGMADSDELGILSYSLETLGAAAEGPSDVATISKLAGRLESLLLEMLERQPGALARRRLREVHQREIETALGALLTSAQILGQETEAGQQFLQQAWNLIMRTRNLDLQVETLEKEADRREQIRTAEDAFHHALRKTILEQHSDEAGWGEALDKVYELERSSPSRLSKNRNDLQSEIPGIGLTLFQFTDLFEESKPLVVLGWKNGAWSAKGINNGDSPLIAAVRQPRPLAGRDFTRTLTVGSPSQTISDFLPADLLGDVVRPAPLTPWYLFPDNRLSALSIEMLPESRADIESFSFGEDRPVQSCLRTVIPPSTRENINLSKGWLGLGGVPAMGQATELPGSLAEVLRVAQILHKQGHAAEVLSGVEAHTDNLTKGLERLHPAVLHIACHGQADPEFPDACFLLLADCPQRPEREILPFRRIGDLPLESVELVVLSACWSSIGRSSRGVGLEGLAWAFLRAGVPQVLATRYPIEDEPAIHFMETFYQTLLTMPAAEALGRTRRKSLQQGMTREQVGAWALWC